jgi:hypothetical protein
MAIARSSSTRSELGPRSGAFLARHKLFIAIELVLLAAFIALTVIVTGHLAPLPGDVGLTLWWQHLVRPHHLLTTVFDEVRAINFPNGVGITLIVFVALFALLRRWLDSWSPEQSL